MDRDELDFHAERRASFAQALPTGMLAIIPAAVPSPRNGDTHFPFRQSSDYRYLTGLDEEGGFLLLGKGQETLFVLDKDPEREQWDGLRLGVEGAQEQTSIEDVRTLSSCAGDIEELLSGADVCVPLSTPGSRERIAQYISQGTGKDWQDAGVWLHQMRQVKQPWEFSAMAKSCSLAAQVHCAAMRSVRPGQWEYELEAVYLHGFRAGGAEHPAYPSIVGGGNNACILHYVSNSERLDDETLVLVDAGCEMRGYASDITRTYPVGGRFTARQRELYSLVLNAQKEILGAIRPGVRHDELQKIGVRAITQGLIDLGIIAGVTLDEALERKSYLPFYMHRFGHFLGMDVHDCGSYTEEDGSSLRLQPGMALTVEPGCYIMRGLENVAPHWQGIGIRIEDDVLVTQTGCEILTSEVPSEIEEVEALCREVARAC